MTTNYKCIYCNKFDWNKINYFEIAEGLFGSIEAMQSRVKEFCGCDLETYWYRGPETVEERMSYLVMNLNYDDKMDDDRSVHVKNMINFLNRQSKKTRIYQKWLKRAQKQDRCRPFKKSVMKNRIHID